MCYMLFPPWHLLLFSFCLFSFYLFSFFMVVVLGLHCDIHRSS
jgi:hypothetical protein